jgi:hypothetical protein
VAAVRVARQLGCTSKNAELRIVDAGIKDHIKAVGTVEGWAVSPLSTAWRGAVDLAGTTMRPPGVPSYEITNLQLCFGYLVSAGLLTTPAFERKWWTAAEALAWIIMGVPLAWEEWEGLPELVARMEWAGRELARVIGEDRVRAQGRLSPEGEMQPLPGSDLRIPGFKWRVGPEGDLGTSPPGPLMVFEGRRWYGIEIDSATVREAFVRLLTVQADPTPTKTARTQPKKRSSTRGPLPKTTERVVTAIKDDIRTGHLPVKEGRLFKGSDRAQQKYLTGRYKCSPATLYGARDIALLELETPTNSD